MHLTEILERLHAGDRRAREDLFNAVYGELQQLARHKMNRENPEHTWTASDLVHEAFLKLDRAGTWRRFRCEKHLYAAAATAMRLLLIDHARGRKAAKRGGNRDRVPLDDVQSKMEQSGIDVVELTDAIEVARALHPEAIDLLEQNIFAEAGTDDLAKAWHVSRREIQTRLFEARAIVRRFLKGHSDELGEDQRAL